MAATLAALQTRFPVLRPDLEQSGIPPAVFVGVEITATPEPLRRALLGGRGMNRYSLSKYLRS
ncbi:MAG: hypothetical protein M5U01_33960 [Ardenticatenaceae bacterium]|nr:hypothetical protein [Ardenticatenaceae bacterium]HBY92793.1 hypothetical protein [Chloroflexota bacterium]